MTIKGHTGMRPNFAWLPLMVALASTHCGTSGQGPTGTSGGSAGSSGGATGGAAGAATGGSSGFAGTGGAGSGGSSGGSADAAADTGGRDAGNGSDVSADRITEDRIGPDGEPGCSYPEPAPTSCYVAGSLPRPTPLVDCTRVPRGIREVQSSQFRYHNGMFYWVNGGNVVRLNGSTVEAITFSQDATDALEVDDDAVYYLAASDAGQFSLRRAKLDKSGPVTIATDVRYPFILSGDRVYFDTADGRFASTSKLGGGSIDPVAGPTSVNQLFLGRLIDATHLYWNESADGGTSDVTLFRLAKGSTTVETVATHLPGPAVLLEGEGVLISVENEYILEMPKSGGCPQWLVDTTKTTPFVDQRFNGIAADDTSIYWAQTYPSDTSDLLLFRSPRRGGVAIQVLTDGSGIRGGSAPLLTPTQAIIRGDGMGYLVWTIDRP